jgi:hypothetical protein
MKLFMLFYYTNQQVKNSTCRIKAKKEFLIQEVRFCLKWKVFGFTLC